MQRRGKGSWGKKKAQRRSRYKRSIRFNPNQVHQVAVVFRTISFECLLAQMVHGVSMCVGSVSSKDRLFPPVFFLSSLPAMAKGEIGYEADYGAASCFAHQNEQSRSCIPRVAITRGPYLQGREYGLIKVKEREVSPASCCVLLVFCYVL